VKCIIYSDDKHKIYWDIFIVILLVVVCTIIPWRLAFDGESKSWDITYYLMDSMFLLDMIVTFFTTIPSTEGMTEITDKKEIAVHYFKTWFSIDLLSIAPFDLIL